MRLLLVTILLVSTTLAGCSNVSAPYLITKDRVDQKLEGNRGYLLGTPPPAPAERPVPKRTIIGIDVEIPILPGEKGYKTSYKGPVIREEDVTMNLRVK